MTNQRLSPLDLHIAKRIGKLRKGGAEAQVSLAQVARYLGMSYQSYRDIENGKTAIRATTLALLAEYHGVPVSYFFGGDAPPVIPNQEDIAVVTDYMRSMHPMAARSLASQIKALSRA